MQTALMPGTTPASGMSMPVIAQQSLVVTEIAVGMAPPMIQVG
jgi:hypothetical protein